MPRRLLLLLACLLCAGCIGIPIHAKTKKKVFPASFSDMHYEQVEVPAGKDVVLRGVWVPQDGPPVLLLYGSGMGYPGAHEAMRMLHDGGYAVLCCDYRGTGYSSGRWWTSRNLDDDARALWEWLIREKGTPAGVFGISIGTIAGAKLTSHSQPPAAIVLDRPVDPRSVIANWTRSELGGFASFVSALLFHAKCDVDMSRCLKEATAPTLVVLPEYDVFLPPKDAARMIEGHSGAVETAVMPGGHLSSHLVEPTRWRSAILDFLDARLRPGQPHLGGRVLPTPKAFVEGYTLEGRRLTVRLDRDPARLPPRLTLLICGLKGNALATYDHPGREIVIDFTGRQWRKLGRRIFTVQVGYEGMEPPKGTRWRIDPAEPPPP